MQQRPLVYVSRITNLSDARYCAGMGVDLLGFAVDPADPDYVSPEAYQQLVGWISGPARVIETGPVMPDLNKIAELYAPEYLHVPWLQIVKIPEGRWKLIVEIPNEDLGKLTPRKDIVYVLLDTSAKARVAAPGGIPVLVNGRPGSGPVMEFLEASGAAGIALRGTREVTPGLKDYDHLSQVLEELNG